MSAGRAANRSFYPWVLVALLWFIFLLNYLDREVIFTVFPLLQKNLKLSDLELGLLSTSFLWVYAIASPLIGFLADRFGRKKVIVVSLMIWSLMTWATGKARNFRELLAVRGLMGISEAAYLPAGLAMIADHHSERTRSLATGIHYSGAYLGIVLGGVAGGWIGEHYGWRPAFTFLGILGVAYALVALLGLREKQANALPKAERPQAAKPRLSVSLRKLFALRGFTTLTLVFGMMSVANWLVYTWLPIYLYERFHMSLLGAGFSATVYIQVGSVGGILLGGILADRWATRFPRGRLMTQAAGLALAAPFLCIIGITGSGWVLLAALTIFGIGRGSYDCSCMPVLSQIASPELRATGYGVFNFVGTFAGGISAALAGGLKHTIGLGGAMVAASVVVLFAALLLFRLKIVTMQPV
jgi:MFS family permease